MFAGRTAARDMRQTLARLLLCSLDRHSAQRPYFRSGTHRFARCRWCGCDLVRTDGPWHRPKGHRIVWPDALRSAPQRLPANIPIACKESQPAEGLESAAQDRVDREIEVSPPPMPSERPREHSTKELLEILERLKEAKPARFLDSVQPSVRGDEIAPIHTVVAPPEPVTTDPAATQPVATIAPDFMSDDGADGFSWESEVPQKAEISPSRAACTTKLAGDLPAEPGSSGIGSANGGRDDVRRYLPAGTS